MGGNIITSTCTNCQREIRRADDGAWETTEDGRSGCSFDLGDAGSVYLEHDPSSQDLSATVSGRGLYNAVTVELIEDAHSGVLICRADNNVSGLTVWSASRDTAQAIGCATHAAMSGDGWDLREGFTSDQSEGHALGAYLQLERSTATM